MRDADRAGAWSLHADVVFTNGSVAPVDSAFTIARALAVKDGRARAVAGR